MEHAPELAQARALHRAGRSAEAEAACHAALAKNTADADAWYLLSLVAVARGDALYAEAAARRALSLRPDFAEAEVGLAISLRRGGKLADAEAQLRDTIRRTLRPSAAMLELADLLRERGVLSEAEAVARELITLEESNAPAWHLLGVIRQARGDLPAAESCFRRAIEHAPGFVAALVNLGALKLATDQLDEAVAILDRALALAPDYGIGHWNRALALLTAGNYERAWSDYDWRWRIPELLKNAQVRVLEKRWRGEPVAGKRILLQSEQGLGDTIQFARYAPLVAARGAEVTLAVQPMLVPLLKQLRNLERVIAINGSLPPFDLQASLPDLPGIFGTTLATIPDARGYLTPDPLKVADWRARLQAERRPKVGLVWAGNARHLDDTNRSLKIAALAPLFKRENIAWHSLQVDDGGKRIAPGEMDLPIVDLAPSLRDFSDTAAALAALDLLISVDTAPAHLGGALGVPTWILVTKRADWRWMRDRADSPWYSSIRLFRQEGHGDWHGVIDRLCAALDASFASRG